MLSVRNITGYAVTVSDIAPKAEVRHVTGYAFYSKSRFDRAVLGRTNLLNVIASECLGVLDNICTVGPSIAADEVGKKNTKVLITAKAIGGYRSDFYMYYNRIQIDRCFPDTAWKLTIPTETTLHSIIPAINAAYGCNLVTDDVVDHVVSANATVLKITANSASYMFIPGTTVQLGISLPTLSSLVTVTNLPGFESVTG